MEGAAAGALEPLEPPRAWGLFVRAVAAVAPRSITVINKQFNAYQVVNHLLSIIPRVKQ